MCQLCQLMELATIKTKILAEGFMHGHVRTDHELSSSLAKLLAMPADIAKQFGRGGKTRCFHGRALFQMDITLSARRSGQDGSLAEMTSDTPFISCDTITHAAHADFAGSDGPIK